MADPKVDQSQFSPKRGAQGLGLDDMTHPHKPTGPLFCLGLLGRNSAGVRTHIDVHVQMNMILLMSVGALMRSSAHGSVCSGLLALLGQYGVPGVLWCRRCHCLCGRCRVAASVARRTPPQQKRPASIVAHSPRRSSCKHRSRRSRRWSKICGRSSCTWTRTRQVVPAPPSPSRAAQ